ncbi:hypothetical protein [Microcystis sp. LE19-195.1E]|nr:hypothetical protein [Microcystis sp. LE19-195.1E]
MFLPAPVFRCSLLPTLHTPLSYTFSKQDLVLDAIASIAPSQGLT